MFTTIALILLALVVLLLFGSIIIDCLCALATLIYACIQFAIAMAVGILASPIVIGVLLIGGVLALILL